MTGLNRLPASNQTYATMLSVRLKKLIQYLAALKTQPELLPETINDKLYATKMSVSTSTLQMDDGPLGATYQTMKINTSFMSCRSILSSSSILYTATPEQASSAVSSISLPLTTSSLALYLITGTISFHT